MLHSWDWSETSLIVELFTRERGRVVVVAKGAKRPYSQLRPVLIPFQRLWVQLGRAPADESAEVHLLRSAERAGGPADAGAGAALFAGFYLNELLLKLLARQDAHGLLFDAYAEAVARCRAPTTAACRSRCAASSWLLLRELGVLPELDQVTLTVHARSSRRRCTRCTRNPAWWRPPQGGVPGHALVALEAALAAGHGAALRGRRGAR